ncbi:hypothetical protein K3495_g8197 [Podosphaera aphanis]|nr:hypothetical protein K3495_g8197 [Podosphaera aphanis]
MCLSCYENIPDAVKFFSRVRHERHSPFWVEQQLVLRSQYRPFESIALDDVANDTDSKTDIWEEEPEYVDEELDDSDDENLPDYSERFLTLFNDLKDLVHEQKGNTKFLKRFVEGNLRNFTLLDEIKHLKAQMSMSKTWSSRKHSDLLFYKRKES